MLTTRATLSRQMLWSFFKFHEILIQWKKYWICDVRFIFNEKSDYSKENISSNEVFRSTIFQSFQFEPEQRKTWGNEGYEKETKHSCASAAYLLHIRIGNRNWWKCGHCKNEAKETDCLCSREVEVDPMLINSAKFPQREGSISPFRFFTGNCLTISHAS